MTAVDTSCSTATKLPIEFFTIAALCTTRVIRVGIMPKKTNKAKKFGDLLRDKDFVKHRHNVNAFYLKMSTKKRIVYLFKLYWVLFDTHPVLNWCACETPTPLTVQGVYRLAGAVRPTLDLMCFVKNDTMPGYTMQKRQP